jgi:sn-glycerol 3-phosphate transport system substrate-binding protein
MTSRSLARRALRLGAAATSLVLAVGLAACGGEPETTDGKIKLVMYYPVAVGGPLTKVVDKLVADYESTHQDVDIEAIYSGTYRDTMTKAQTAFRAGSPPDLAVLLSTELYSLTDAKMIVSYDELLGGAGKEWLDSFYPALMKNSRDGAGTTWGIPFQRSTIVQYYNKDLFRKAGLDPEKGPTTWDELVTMAEKIKSSGAAPFGIEIPSTDYGYWMLQALAVQNGKEMFHPDGTKVYLDDPKVVEALQFLVDLGKRGVMPTGTIEWGSTPQDFLQGKTAIMWTTTGNLTNVKNNAKFEFGVTPLPAKVQPGSPTGGGNLYIFQTKDRKRQLAALEFVKWLSSPERAAEWSIATGYIATSPAAYETEAMKKYVADFPAALVARDQLEQAVAELSTHEEGRMLDLVNDAVAAAVTGQKTPQQALSDAQKQAASILQRYQ